MSVRVTATEASTITWYAEGDQALEPPYSAWTSPGGWRADLRFDVDALGELAQAGSRYVSLRAMSPYRETAMIAHLGDTTHGPGISVFGPTSTAYAAVSLTSEALWVLSMDTRAGVLRGKLWPYAVFEPAGWDVEVALDNTGVEEADRIELSVGVGNVISEQSVTIHKFEASLAAANGNLIVADLIGLADGETMEFKTSHKFSPHTIHALVNGVTVLPRYAEPDAAWFKLDGYPTDGSIIRARYHAVRTITGDE